MFALIDCNNFYASCERLFRPDLRSKPIIVLSNNDGCVIARSNEAKSLGIRMGEPYFKIKPLCNQYQVHVFSSNFALYGDLSERIMSIITESYPETEIYSIDEAFLDLKELPPAKQLDFATTLHKRILKETGIPTSVGIGKTKTLAKVANHIAKKRLNTPVVQLENPTFWLSQLPVHDVWGVGKQWAKKLMSLNILTAEDLMHANPTFIRKQANVILERTVYELKGYPCLELHEIEEKKSIISSRSFGTPQTQFEDIRAAVCAHIARAWEKVRQQQSLVQYLSVFIQTSRFRTDQPQYSNTSGFKLVTPSDDLRYLTQCAIACLERIFKEKIEYKKAGVHFEGLIPKTHLQYDFFDTIPESQRIAHEKLMNTIEKANQRFGRGTLRLAAEGYTKPWALKQVLKSPSYTTQWEELPIVYLK